MVLTNNISSRGIQVVHSPKPSCLGKREKLVHTLSRPNVLVLGEQEDLHLIVHVLLLVELTLILSGGILVLLVLGDKVVHVGLSLSELHLVHTLTSVPMKESLTTEHASELLGHTLPELLDCSGVTNEDGCHL